jgi:hypothetical protein
MQNLKQISHDLADDLELMEFPSWIKFGYHTNITPHVLTPEEHVQIFRTLEQESLSRHQGDDEHDTKLKAKVDYDVFKRGLIRILILSKQKL